MDMSNRCQTATFTSTNGHQLHVSYFNSSKSISLDSQNVISKPKFNALSNGIEIISKFSQEIGCFSTLKSNSSNFP